MSGDLSIFPRLTIAIGEKQLWHLAECEPASCPLVGRVVSCLRARELLTGQSQRPAHVNFLTRVIMLKKNQSPQDELETCLRSFCFGGD